jgi:putative ABC transport system ATP-binding protein
VLEVQGLQHTFFRGTANEVPALGGVDLQLQAGDFVFVLGANGSGKSTLLNAVAGTFVPDEGRVTIDGTDVTRWAEHRRAQLVGRVFQNPLSGTAPHLTVAENLALALERTPVRTPFRWALGSARRAELRERVRALGLGLEERLGAPIGALSGGQRQALTLLMATLVRPRLLLLDEHTAALDPRSAEQVVRLTQGIVAEQGLTTLMVTHSMHQAVRLGTRVLMMHRGRVVRDIQGTAKRRLRVEDLLGTFEELRNMELLDESASDMLRRLYV